MNKACKPCAESKVKCDGGNPCSRCEKRGADKCIYPTRKARSPNRRGRMGPDLAALDLSHRMAMGYGPPMYQTGGMLMLNPGASYGGPRGAPMFPMPALSPPIMGGPPHHQYPLSHHPHHMAPPPHAMAGAGGVGLGGVPLKSPMLQFSPHTPSPFLLSPHHVVPPHLRPSPTAAAAAAAAAAGGGGGVPTPGGGVRADWLAGMPAGTALHTMGGGMPGMPPHPSAAPVTGASGMPSVPGAATGDKMSPPVPGQQRYLPPGLPQELYHHGGIPPFAPNLLAGAGTGGGMLKLELSPPSVLKAQQAAAATAQGKPGGGPPPAPGAKPGESHDAHAAAVETLLGLRHTSSFHGKRPSDDPDGDEMEEGGGDGEEDAAAAAAAAAAKDAPGAAGAASPGAAAAADAPASGKADGAAPAAPAALAVPAVPAVAAAAPEAAAADATPAADGAMEDERPVKRARTEEAAPAAASNGASANGSTESSGSGDPAAPAAAAAPEAAPAAPATAAAAPAAAPAAPAAPAEAATGAAVEPAATQAQA